MTRVPVDRDFRWLFDAAVDAMLLADTGGAILARNASCERLFGYAGEEWAKLAIENLIPERFRNTHRRLRAAYAEHPLARPMGRGTDLCGLRKDGSEFIAKISLSVLDASDGPLVLAIVEDVTAQRRTEADLLRNAQQLREREALLDLAVRSVGLASWEWNPQTDAAYLSPEWKAQLGYADDELPGRAAEWRSRLHPDEIEAVDALVGDLRSGSRREVDTKYRLRHRDGSYRWMESRVVALAAPEGEGQRFLGIQWDVTDQEIASQQLAAWRAELSSLRQHEVAMETAMAIAHELNQPLNAVMAYSEAALLMKRQGDSDKLGEALTGAVAQAERAGLVVRELMQFLEQRDIPTQAADLNRIVGEAVSLVLADDHPGFRIVVSLFPNLPPVLGNELHIKKVIANLLRNGVEAMAGADNPAGPITVTVSTDEDGAMAHVSVSDSGPGLDPAAVGRIFEPFFTTKPRGIGMGLATSRRIVERLGGKLWFEHASGGGAVFHFTLPFAQ